MSPKPNFMKQIISLILLLITAFQSNAQLTSNKLLIRDSLDYKGQKLSINTNSDEFSPIPYKGGLLYISNQPIKEIKSRFNKIYWSADPRFKITDTLGNANAKEVKKIKVFNLNGNSDDFTAPTSNDNDILFNFKKLKLKSNGVEALFSEFSTDQAFAYDEKSNLLIYAKKSNKKVKNIKHWELWQANIINGKLKNKKRLSFVQSTADFLYPYLANEGSRLYFASNLAGGLGGFDIYYANKVGADWSLDLTHLNESINSKFDDISPFVLREDSIYFSSNREGGLGGFDIYGAAFNNAGSVSNLGYPLNSSADELSLSKFSNQYFLTSNKSGNFDISNLEYLPVFVEVKGILTYKSDGSLVKNHLLNLKDKEANLVLSSLSTDTNAHYQFIGKPNRLYEFTTLNGDSIFESFAHETPPNALKVNFASSIHGRSEKQKADSLNQLWAMRQKMIDDSIALHGLNNKFIVYYDFNKSVISKKETIVLDSLLNKLSKMPNAYVVVGAFTDCIGSYKYNYTLSVKRANAVVQYLMKHGLNKNRLVKNGYSKNYTVSPCSTKSNKYSKQLQQNSRRAEIVLSETKKDNWASLEKKRGANYYSVYNSKNSVLPSLITKIVMAKVTLPKPVSANVKQVDTISVKKEIKTVVKVESRVDSKSIIVSKAVAQEVAQPADKIEVKPSKQINIKSSITAQNNDAANTKPSVIIKPTENVKKEAAVVVEPSKVIVAPSTDLSSNEISKDEILQALDSLAKLKKEQERIVEYLTKRINKKPIDVFVQSDSVMVEIYDNGIHDKDSVSIIYNNRIIVDRNELKVNRPIKFTLKVDKNKKHNDLILVAENLGSEPPNTAVMFITEKSGKRQQVMLSTDMTHNEVVYFIRIGKQ